MSPTERAVELMTGVWVANHGDSVVRIPEAVARRIVRVLQIDGCLAPEEQL